MINLRHSRWLALCMVVVSACLAGCFATTSSPGGTSPSATSVPSPTTALSPGTELPTRVFSPVALTVTTLPVHTPVPPASTPYPTLTADQERAFVVEMLETNGGCELPCWWSITPGKTTWQDVRDQLGLYYGHGIPQPDGVHYEAVYGGAPHTKPLFGYYIALEFTELGGTVQSIQVISEVDRNAQASHFVQDWRHYSLNQVLGRYGIPSQVRMHIVPEIEPGASPYYTLGLGYDHLGFYILYLGPAVSEPPVMRVCPRFGEVTGIILYLQSPQPGEPVLSDDTPTLEEATGMDVETFYETFKNADSDVCLESPAEMWP